MATLIFSYSHKDEGLRDELAAHLAPLRREGLIETWHDRRIVAGQSVDAAIDEVFKAAHVILLLVSPDFINSDYCFDIEMRYAMQRHENGEAIVIPVILRPCDWHRMPLGRLLAVPLDGRPVTSWSNRDEAFHDVARSLRRALEDRGPERHHRREPVRSQGNRDAGLRSRNVNLPRRFTEKDRDDFLHETFEHIAQFFEGSLREVEQQNRGVETRFRRLDASRLTAVAYRDGRAVSRCTIWVGRTHMNGIGYVGNDSGETNSFNENLSVETGDRELYLKPLGVASIGQGRIPDKLAPDAAAELGSLHAATP